MGTQTGEDRTNRLVAALLTAVLIALLIQIVVAPIALGASLSIDPYEVDPGSSVSVGGAGFEEEEIVALCWDRAGCSNLGRLKTDDDGEFRVSVRIPNDASPGPHAIYACQSEVGCAQGSLLILEDENTTTTIPSTTTTIRPTTTTIPPTTTTVALTTTTIPLTTTTSPAGTTTSRPGSIAPFSTTLVTSPPTTVEAISSGGDDYTTIVDDALLSRLGEDGPEVLSRSISPDSTADGAPDAETSEANEDEDTDDDLPVAFGDSGGGLLRGPAAMTVGWLGVMLLAVVVVLGVDGLRRRRSG